MSELTEKVKKYYELRGIVWPANADISLQFLTTELAEALEILLDRAGTWVRNNPESKPKFNLEDLGVELGDIIMMAIVAGISEGIDPVDCLVAKMQRKVGQEL